MCGEKSSGISPPMFSRGSPPRVRGKGSGNGTAAGRLRITPACAGKRSTLGHVKPADEDHPRVCGEKTVLLSITYPRLGSPPRVRGKVTQRAGYIPHAGITPACAGKRACSSSWRGPHRDHPRVCGEKLRYLKANASYTGSPPRVRGKGLAW